MYYCSWPAITPWGTAGQEQYDAINDASFTDIDVFILCFALSQAREVTLENAEAKVL